MDRWAGNDGEDDRWAEPDRRYDRWAEPDPRYDHWAQANGESDRWAEPDRRYDHWAEADGESDRWAEPDRRYDHWAGTDPEYHHLAERDGADGRHDGQLGLARRPAAKWVGLLIAWVAVTGLLLSLHLTILIWVVMAGLIAYVVYCILRDTPRAERPQRRRPSPAEIADDDHERFNAPPGWPDPPPGWTPPPGWQPNPAWPPAPPGWQFWLPPDRRGFAERAVRARHYRSDPDVDPFRDGWR